MTNLSDKLNRYFRRRQKQLLHSNLVKSSEKLLRKLVIPGFDGMPVYDVAVFFIQGIQKGALSMRAAAFSYNLFLALFPAIIFFFTIIPYIPIAGFQDNLLGMLQNFIPKKALMRLKVPCLILLSGLMADCCPSVSSWPCIFQPTAYIV